MFELNRGQNDCRLVSYNATTGEKIAELYRETSDKYVEPLHPIEFLPWDATKFVMQSQKDGYNHLYLFDKNGKELKQLTKGPWVVMKLVGFNQKQKSIIIKANKEHPLHHRLYSVNMKGEIKQLETVDGVHNAKLSASGSFLVDEYVTPTRPRVIDIVDISHLSPLTSHLLEAETSLENHPSPLNSLRLRIPGQVISSPSLSVAVSRPQTA